MNAEIISIGTELLLGHIVNTNTSFLSKKLAEIGIDVFHTSVVGDNTRRLFEAIKQALGRADIVITTGGLGPTVDDITIETISGLIDRRSIKWIRNRVGTAPGLLIDHIDRKIICLPGPPRELIPMFEKDIIPYLKKGSKSAWVIKSRTLKITGLSESAVNKAVKDLLELKPPTTVGIYAKLGEVDLRIMSKAKDEKSAQAAIQKIEKNIRLKLKGHIFGYDGDKLEDAVGKMLAAMKMTIAVAESCTGGLLSDRITNVSGSSGYFRMGLVAYSDAVKENILGVSKVTLQKYGAVSRPVALEMARGIKLLAGADIGVGITGIAGPTGGTKAKPIGLVHIAIVTGLKRIAKECRFKGSREEIKFRALQAALDLIRRNL